LYIDGLDVKSASPAKLSLALIYRRCKRSKRHQPLSTLRLKSFADVKAHILSGIKTKCAFSIQIDLNNAGCCLGYTDENVNVSLRFPVADKPEGINGEISEVTAARL
jgi:hypothetical protein